MPFLIDDLLLQMLGVSIPPFDLIWIMQTISDYILGVQEKEINEKINNMMKENRLLYELSEITREEYEKRAEELNRQRRISNRTQSMNLRQRINILGNES